MTFVVSRIPDEDKSVLSWGVSNEATSVIHHVIAYVNDTLTTLINHFMAISYHIGQKHTLITADQPMYTWSKELLWAYPKLESFIFLMGGLRICFNLLKRIDQQMDSTRLDDLWTEAVVYAAHSIQTMLDDKAY